ncbi:MAG: thioredoxin family protein [Cyanobacteriota bacterium]
MKKVLLIIIPLLLIIIIYFSYILLNNTPKKSEVNLGEYVYAEDNSVNDVNEMLKTSINGDRPVILMFYSQWCGSCRKIRPAYETVRDEYSDKAVFIDVDVDENPDLAGQFKVFFVPSLFALNTDTKEVYGLPAHKMATVTSFKSVLDDLFDTFTTIKTGKQKDKEPEAEPEKNSEN